MEREVGGGIGMGNTCKPMAVSFQCMTKSTTKKKKKNNHMSKCPFAICNIINTGKMNYILFNKIFSSYNYLL